jgi:tetratricopeptide (TPR) repeat protein
LQVSAVDTGTGKSYTIHSVIHHAIQYSLSPQERSNLLQETAQHLTHIIPYDGEFENWPSWRIYLPHATAFLKNAKENQSLEMSNICYSMASYLQTGSLRAAEVAAQKSIKIRALLLGEHDEYTLQAQALIASIYDVQGRLNEAKELMVKVLEVQKQLLGEEHLKTMYSMSVLATTFCDQGRYEEAKDLHMKVMEMRKRVLGEEHQNTISSMNNLATTFFKQGRYEEVEDLQMKVMETRKRILGEEHPATLRLMQNLAFTL